MENNGNPRTKINKNKLNIYLDVSENNSFEIDHSKINKLSSYIICKDKKDADLIISVNRQKYSLKINNHTNQYFFSNPTSLVNTLTLIATNTLKIRNNGFKTQKKVKIEQGLNKIKKLNKLILGKTTQFSEYQKVHDSISTLKEIKDISRTINTIEDFPFAIINTLPFRAFKTAQLLIHQKGSSTSYNIISDRSGSIINTKIPVEDFNKVFLLIKKSRNKQFNQSNILQKNLGVVGTFIAKEIGLEKYNIILMISRNDFLPPSLIEKHIFESLVQYLVPHLTGLLAKYHHLQKKDHLELALDHFTSPIVISNQNNKPIYANFASDIKCSNLLPLTLISINENLIKINLDNSSIIHETSDIYHHQRISLLGELLNTLKHELNNPIYGVMLTSEILKNDNISEDFSETMGEININCKRCQSIIENFSKLYESNEHFSKVNLFKILNEIVTLTKSESHGIMKEIILNNLDKTFQINTNKTWLTQIIFNFIINSAQSIRAVNGNHFDQKITINVINNDKQSAINISISDTGTGIPNHLVGNILTPFVTTKNKGTGLGLAICNNLSKKLGGEISFSNNYPYPGATFTLTLPYQ